MITKTRAYTSSDGQVHATLEAAQQHELGELFAEHGHPLIQVIVNKKREVVDILTMRDTSRPGARAINGATRTRKAKPPVTKPSRAAHVAGDYAKMRAEVDAAAPVGASA